MAEEIIIQNETIERRPYAPPVIVYELELETRAGSLLNGFPSELELPGE